MFTTHFITCRCAIRSRDPRELRQFVLGLLGISIFSALRSRGGNSQLYTQKKFGWTVTDYTNFRSVLGKGNGLSDIMIMNYF